MLAPMERTQIQQRLQPTLERLTQKAERLRTGGPLPAAFLQSLNHKLRIELTHGSTAIEGNTLTLRETQLLIDEGITPQGAKHLREIHETLNHHKAVLRLQEFVAAGRTCQVEGVCELHRIVLQSIDDERSGSYRTERLLVTIAPQQPIRPERIAEEMEALFSWIKSSELHSVILAGEAHYKFVKIHPFYDGNGRTARLLMNWSLLSSGYPLTVIPAEARARYITSIDDADRGRPLEFFQLLCECVESSLDQYLAS
jgi:Fic family protein